MAAEEKLKPNSDFFAAVKYHVVGTPQDEVRSVGFIKWILLSYPYFFVRLGPWKWVKKQCCKEFRESLIISAKNVLVVKDKRG